MADPRLIELIRPHLEKARQAGYDAGYAEASRRLLEVVGNRVVEYSETLPSPTAKKLTRFAPEEITSSRLVTKAKKPAEPGSDDPHGILLAAMLQHAAECAESGEDPGEMLDWLADLAHDPERMADVLSGAGSAAVKCIGLLILKGKWDEGKHPRGKNGRFLSKDRIQQAATDPKVKAELEKEVRPEDADKLKAAIEDQGGTIGRTKRGEAKFQAGQRRAARKLALGEARKIADKIAGGEGTVEDVDTLASHLKAGLTRDHIRLLQSYVGGGGRRKADMVTTLLDAARDAVTAKQEPEAVEEPTAPDASVAAPEAPEPAAEVPAPTPDATGETPAAAPESKKIPAGVDELQLGRLRENMGRMGPNTAGAVPVGNGRVYVLPESVSHLQSAGVTISEDGTASAEDVKSAIESLRAAGVKLIVPKGTFSAEPVGKPHHEMSQEEWKAAYDKAAKEHREKNPRSKLANPPGFHGSHLQAVMEADQQGKAIPESVRRQYPSLNRPHEMSQDQYDRHFNRQMSGSPGGPSASDQHPMVPGKTWGEVSRKNDVQRAIQSGKSVPPEVLADYPELASAPAPEPEPTAPVANAEPATPAPAPEAAKVPAAANHREMLGKVTAAIQSGSQWHANTEMPNGKNGKQVVDEIMRGDNGRWALPKTITEQGWATDTKFAMKATPQMIEHAKAKGADKIEGRAPNIAGILPKGKGDPATIIGGRVNENGKHVSLMQGEDGTQAQVDSNYVAHIKKTYPNAEFEINNRMVIAKQDGETIGLIMPMGDVVTPRDEAKKPGSLKKVEGNRHSIADVAEPGPYTADDVTENGVYLVVGKDTPNEAKLRITGSAKAGYSILGGGVDSPAYQTLPQVKAAAKELLAHAHGMTEDGDLIFYPKGAIAAKLEGPAKTKKDYYDALKAKAKSKPVKKTTEELEGKGGVKHTRELLHVGDNFAVHEALPDYKGKVKGYTVTHTGSGVAAETFNKRDDALRFAHILQNMPETDWNSFSSDLKENEPEKYKQIIGKFRNVKNAFMDDEYHPDMGTADVLSGSKPNQTAPVQEPAAPPAQSAQEPVASAPAPVVEDDDAPIQLGAPEPMPTPAAPAQASAPTPKPTKPQSTAGTEPVPPGMAEHLGNMGDRKFFRDDKGDVYSLGKGDTKPRLWDRKADWEQSEYSGALAGGHQSLEDYRKSQRGQLSADATHGNRVLSVVDPVSSNTPIKDISDALSGLTKEQVSGVIQSLADSGKFRLWADDDRLKNDPNAVQINGQYYSTVDVDKGTTAADIDAAVQRVTGQKPAPTPAASAAQSPQNPPSVVDNPPGGVDNTPVTSQSAGNTQGGQTMNATDPFVTPTGHKIQDMKNGEYKVQFGGDFAVFNRRGKLVNASMYFTPPGDAVKEIGDHIAAMNGEGSPPSTPAQSAAGNSDNYGKTHTARFKIKPTNSRDFSKITAALRKAGAKFDPDSKEWRIPAEDLHKVSGIYGLQRLMDMSEADLGYHDWQQGGGVA